MRFQRSGQVSALFFFLSILTVYILEKGRFLNKDYTLADLAAEAKKPDWLKVGEERGAELISSLQTLHDEEEFGTRATNNGAATDVANAFSNCVDIVSKGSIRYKC